MAFNIRHVRDKSPAFALMERHAFGDSVENIDYIRKRGQRQTKPSGYSIQIRLDPAYLANCEAAGFRVKMNLQGRPKSEEVTTTIELQLSDDIKIRILETVGTNASNPAQRKVTCGITNLALPQTVLAHLKSITEIIDLPADIRPTVENLDITSAYCDQQSIDPTIPAATISIMGQEKAKCSA